MWLRILRHWSKTCVFCLWRTSEDQTGAWQCCLSWRFRRLFVVMSDGKWNSALQLRAAPWPPMLSMLAGTTFVTSDDGFMVRPFPRTRNTIRITLVFNFFTPNFINVQRRSCICCRRERKRMQVRWWRVTVSIQKLQTNSLWRWWIGKNPSTKPERRSSYTTIRRFDLFGRSFIDFNQRAMISPSEYTACSVIGGISYVEAYFDRTIWLRSTTRRNW